MTILRNALLLFFASHLPKSFAASETTDEYHARLKGLLEESFANQKESTAWWVGLSHPTHGDQHWVFGNSSDSDDTFPPDIPATINDHFYIGSISKSFGASVNLQLIEQGFFALNQTIKSINPDFALEFPQYANYTPRDLMGMQTLVPDFLNDKDGIMKNLLDDPSLRYSIFEIIDAAMTRYPVTLPEEFASINMTVQDFGIDEYHEYSTTNILAMEYLAENITGLPMQDLIQNLVLTPLGLNNTAEPPRDAPSGDIVPEPVVRSYVGPGCVREFFSIGTNVSVGYRNDEFFDSIVNTGTGGNMYSTIVDLLQWAKSGVGDSLLSPETVSVRHIFNLTSLFRLYGLGMHVIYVPPEYGNAWYGHDGDAFGSNARAAKNDELGIAFASAINTCGNEDLHMEGFKILVGDFLNANSSDTSPTITPQIESPTATPENSSTTASPQASSSTEVPSISQQGTDGTNSPSAAPPTKPTSAGSRLFASSSFIYTVSYVLPLLV